MFIGMMMAGGRGGNGSRAAKPGGGSMRLVNPAQIMSAADRAMLGQKLGLLRSAENLALLTSAANLNELASRIGTMTKALFPSAGIILLARSGPDYEVIGTQAVDVDPLALNLSAKNSFVRAAGEVAPIWRRTIYVPDVSKPGIFLASKFDRGARDEFGLENHELEEGPLRESGHNFDLVSLVRAGVSSLAVAPSLEFQNHDPVGAVVLVGNTAFLNPPVDLIALRELADLIAPHLKEKIV